MPAPYDRATLAAAIAADIYTNIAGDIDGDTLAARLLDIIDSVFNLVDETPLTAGDALINLQVFVSSGTYTKTTGAKKAIIIATGAGGGRNVLNPGAAGGTAIDFLDLTGVTTATVTIGAGVSAGTGGTTSVGSHASATGGASGSGSTGGIGTIGDVLLRGGSAGTPNGADSIPGKGGSSFWGGAGAPGSGIDGAVSGGSVAGFAGIAVILEFG